MFEMCPVCKGSAYKENGMGCPNCESTGMIPIRNKPVKVKTVDEEFDLLHPKEI